MGIFGQFLSLFMSFCEIEYRKSSVTMDTRVEMHHLNQNKGKGRCYQMLSLDLENGLYPSSERS